VKKRDSTIERHATSNQGKPDVSVEETGRSNQVTKDGIALAVQSTGVAKSAVSRK